MQAAHCCRTASMAAALGRPWVITADSRATTAAPEATASRTAGAIVRLVTLGMLRGYIQQDAAGVAELVQAHGLGPCGASHGGSSPLARTVLDSLLCRGIHSTQWERATLFFSHCSAPGPAL